MTTALGYGLDKIDCLVRRVYELEKLLTVCIEQMEAHEDVIRGSFPDYDIPLSQQFYWSHAINNAKNALKPQEVEL